jgi:3-hydroxybutyryl-CoA dehydrogenase
MVVDLTREGAAVGIVGAGTMGRGIAQVMAAGGLEVRLFDVRDGAVAEAIGFAGQMIDRATERGRMKDTDGAAAKARLRPAGALADLAGCDLVIEVIVEELEAKRALFAELENLVKPDCILASNTSSLSVTAIASACKSPGRVAGFHFFNPVPVLRVVEVVSGLRTAPEAADALVALARRFGHTPVRAKDSPGFLINHAGRGLGTEGLRIVSEGIASHAEVDDVLREACGFALGPFELLDVIGLDVSHVVMEEIYRQFYDEPRFRPLPETRQRRAAGLYGRKTGMGFYEYRDGKKVSPPAKPAPTRLPERVWIGRTDDATRAALVSLIGDGCAIDTGKRPDARSLCLFAPLGHDATTAALAAGVEAERSVAIDTLFGMDKRRTLMTTPVTDPDLRDEMHALLGRDGTPVTVIHDSPGFVAQRVVATIVNIGCDIAQQRIAAPDDIDKAVRLGLAYPKGPLEWGDALGPARVLAIIEAMCDFYRDPRYRPSPWLVRRARLGVSLTTPEN